MLSEFKQKGYLHLKQVIPKEIVDETRFRAIQLSKKYKPLFGEPRHNGSGRFWKGFELASTLDPNMWKLYTAPFMLDIVKTYLETDTPYLFNDQVVVKLPNEEFSFPEHFDNQYGPDPEGALNGDFQTINFMWALTNVPKESGALEIKNKETGNWDLVEAEAGDIIAIDGNTYHRSGHNQTDKIRAMYACVYSTKQMNFEGFHNRRWKFCSCKDGIVNRKLPKEENNLWEKV